MDEFTALTRRTERRYTQSSEKASRRTKVKFKIEIGREDDGRWIAEIASLPGVMAYGKTRQEAIAKAEALALRVVADQTEERKTPIKSSVLSFACNK